ncbi:unnamed protein product, partial [Mycena citricolor]
PLSVPEREKLRNFGPQADFRGLDLQCNAFDIRSRKTYSRSFILHIARIRASVAFECYRISHMCVPCPLRLQFFRFLC